MSAPSSPPVVPPRALRLLMLAVVLLASVLRVYRVSDVPAGLFCDEAALGFDAHCIARGGIDELGNRMPLFFWSFGVSYKNPVYIYAAAVPVRILGLSEFSLRLTSALFGIATVIAIYFLGRTMFDPWVGVCAAFFLAVTPWHIHFSRIAFELISFPLLFIIGVTLLVRFTQGRRTLWGAMVFFGLCVYAYAIADLFVPLFLLGFALLNLRLLMRRWNETWRAVVALVATIAPAAIFLYWHQQLSTYRFRESAAVFDEAGPRAQLVRFAYNYLTFFSPSFLVQHGDPLLRHAVTGFGELLPACLPFVVVGIIVTLVRRDRAAILILWWLALYPLAPSLMNEVPSASRGIIGVPAFVLLAAIGLVGGLRLPARLSSHRLVLLGVRAGVLLVTAYFLSGQLQRYLRAYFVDYPKYAAMNNDGFQYGYRETIEYMESQRSNYDQLLLTATDVNHPEVFPLFYNHPDPWKWVQGNRTYRELGYTIVDPADASGFPLDRRNLYQLHPSELTFFSDYTVKREVVAPNGETAWVIADIRKRKGYLTDWLVLGLFDNTDERGVNADFIDLQRFRRDRHDGAFGSVYWRRLASDSARVDLNRFFATGDPRHPGNPEFVCAYAAATVRSPLQQNGLLELSGSEDTMQIWLNGRALWGDAEKLSDRPTLVPVTLSAGSNLMLVKSCERTGYWYFTARFTEYDGRDLPGINVSAELPFEAPPTVRRDTAPPQLVEGFDGVVAFGHRETSYPDYRGNTESWSVKPREPLSDLAWRTASCSAKRRTIFVFAASMSNDPGGADLYVNEDFALTFNVSGDRSLRRWTHGDYSLTFVPKADVGGNSGIMLLEVPAAQITAGQPVELRVIPASGHHASWFMVKGYGDVITHDQLTAVQVQDLIGHAPVVTAQSR